MSSDHLGVVVISRDDADGYILWNSPLQLVLYPAVDISVSVVQTEIAAQNDQIGFKAQGINQSRGENRPGVVSIGKFTFGGDMEVGKPGNCTGAVTIAHVGDYKIILDTHGGKM